MNKNRHGKIRVKKLIVFILMALAAAVILIFGIGKGVSYLLGKVDTGNSPVSYYLFIGADKEAGNEAEQMLINIHKKALPYSSGRLFIGKVCWFFLKAQFRKTNANSTGGDQDDLETAVL
jgi:hypothetical protein